MKGQVATEYMILLAIVLVISLSVVGTFLNFSTITQSFGSRTLTDFWKSADIAITAHTLYSNETAVFIIRNNKGYSIILDKIAIEGADYEVGTAIYPGRAETITLDNVPAGSKDSYYSHKISFKYKDAENPSRGDFVFDPGMKISGNYE